MQQGLRKTLYLYNWTYYTPDSVIEKFEKEYGVKVVYDDYASNEDMYAKLKAGGSGYDIVIPSGDYVSIMRKQGMLERIDLAKIPNAKYIRPEALAKATYDQAMEYSVPYYMGAAGVAVNTDKVKEFEQSWNIFARKDLAGRMSMMDDMREVLGDALAYLGYSVNTTNDEELEKAYRLVNEQWKPNLVKFDARDSRNPSPRASSGSSKATPSGRLRRGAARDAPTRSPSSSPRRREEGDVPRQHVHPKGARNVELAHKFIDFITLGRISTRVPRHVRVPLHIHAEAGAHAAEEAILTRPTRC
jgi:spermidine/putrescine transport system substrate-binding protein